MSGQISITSEIISCTRDQIRSDGIYLPCRFHAIIDCIRANGLEPMCTLHHFTHPQWFEEMGGFTKEENITVFVAYCKRMFGWFAPKIKLWATFNEPTCFSFVGYIAGLWCPGNLMGFTKCGEVCFLAVSSIKLHDDMCNRRLSPAISQVLCNLLKAHVEAYKELKMLPGGQESCIGLVHQHIKFVPKTDCCSPHIG